MNATDFANIMTNTCTVYHCTSVTEFGKPTYGTGITYPCLIASARNFSLMLEGKDDMPSIDIYLVIQDDMVPVAFDDKVVPSITWDGLDTGDGTPKRIEQWVDPTTNVLLGQKVSL